jgi:hypothetical protein
LRGRRISEGSPHLKAKGRPKTAFLSRIGESDFGAICFWMEAGRRVRAAMSCRKSEIKLSLPHEQSIPFACRIVGPPSRRLFRDDKSARKKTSLKILCNPLISLDSVERIQGNPSFSNPQNLGFSQRNGTFQENPNPVDERRRDRRREGAKPTPSKCTAV